MGFGPKKKLRLETNVMAACKLLSDNFANIYKLGELEMLDFITKLDKYLKQLPIIGVNPGKYDINHKTLFCYKLYR